MGVGWQFVEGEQDHPSAPACTAPPPLLLRELAPRLDTTLFLNAGFLLK